MRLISTYTICLLAVDDNHHITKMPTPSPGTSFLPDMFKDTEIIADPLNKLISLSGFEKRIICTPEFQRLRRIKQLGFANFVYPAAEYTRFVHSLGACHQAKIIVDTINKNINTSRRYQRWRIHGSDAKDIEGEVDLLISPFERVLISAAALLHDLPHGPFSHEIEGIPQSDGSSLIPDHDDLAKNPAFFLYLFDTRVSDLAVLLKHCNAEFHEPFLAQASGPQFDSASQQDLTKIQSWRYALRSLRDNSVVTEEGLVPINSDHPISYVSAENEQFKALPLLAVLIFEILLFEKQKQWLTSKERQTLLNTKDDSRDFGVIVSTSWDAGGPCLRWKPLPGWFRAYRKDIIGNTICADLIDYVNRDGYHTGIVSSMDLKFLDRMVIARAVLPPIGEDGQPDLKPASNRTNYNDIPSACEHVVFDIYDHKRGFIRQSVLTEIMAYLQGRYLLCERVYIHRVVEAARSMLQEAMQILGSMKKASSGAPLLSVSDIHPLNAKGVGNPLAPIGDDALLNWIRAIPALEVDTYNSNRQSIDRAIELATMLTERRVFREVVIFDGIHGFEHSGLLSGARNTCRALEAAFLTDNTLRSKFIETQANLDVYLESQFVTHFTDIDLSFENRVHPKVHSLIGVRRWGKRYKPPLVLVARPLATPSAAHSGLDVEPLLDCEDPPNIRKQLDALKDSYDGLWKVYLFVHPVFHDIRFKTASEKAQETMIEFAKTYAAARWRNAVVFKNLLPEKPIDNPSLFCQKQETKSERDSKVKSSFLAVLQDSVENVFRTDDSHSIDTPPPVAAFLQLSKTRAGRERIEAIRQVAQAGNNTEKVTHAFQNLLRQNKAEFSALAAQSLEHELLGLLERAAKQGDESQPNLNI